MMKQYGLLGKKLAHSFSPQIHQLLASYDYKLYEKEPDEVHSFLVNGEFDGLNVTIPYKKTVIPYCAQLSDTASRIGCVNTIIKRQDRTFYGDNTDYNGFLYLIKQSGISMAGKKVLILGGGASSLTVHAVLTDLRADECITVSRSGENNYNNLYRHYDAQVIVNTTPVGMYPNNGTAPVDLQYFDNSQAVFDLIYNPAKTKLLLDAEALGIPYTNGLPMLVAQAKRACEIFLGKAVDDSCIDDITQKLSRTSKNIALIGMPGCGKSTVGKVLAEITARTFFDTDEWIVSKAGKTIPQIFSEDGEGAFRTLETEALTKISKQSGTVIATGGGIVTQKRNQNLLEQNSVIVFLNCSVDLLPVDGRPVSQSNDIVRLFHERLPLYQSWSSIEFLSSGVEQTAKKIKEHFKL